MFTSCKNKIKSKKALFHSENKCMETSAGLCHKSKLKYVSRSEFN